MLIAYSFNYYPCYPFCSDEIKVSSIKDINKNLNEKSFKHNEDKLSNDGKEVHGNDPKFNNNAHLKKSLSTSTPSFSVMPVTMILIIILESNYKIYL